MPRLKTKHRRRIDLPPGTIMQLRSGHDFFGDGFGLPPADAIARQSWEQDLREAWSILRDRVMESCVQHFAVSWPARPWAWWVFEHGDLERPARGRAEAEALERIDALSADERERFLRLCAKEATP